LAALTLTACGGGAGHTTTHAPQATAGGGVVDRDVSHQEHPPAPAPPPLPGLRHLRASLSRVLRVAGPATGVNVYDLTARTGLFALRDGVGRPPASVEKLYTTVAAVRKLGLHARLHTVVLGTGHLGPRGVWHGDLYLKGGGDPTFGDGTFNKVWERGYGPTAAELVRQLQRRGIRSVTGRVIGDGSIFDAARGGPRTDFGPDVPDYGGQLAGLTYDHGSTVHAASPEAFAAKQLAATMHAVGMHASAARLPGAAPRRARRLAMVSSPPLPILLSLMDVPSDDLFADLLTKQLGRRFAGDGSIAAGAKVISTEMSDYDLHPRIEDGSGLAPDDRSSPAEIVGLLRKVWHTGVGHALSASLPIVGVNGTTTGIGNRTAARGRCIAKTGTLDYVTNLAGYCHSRGGHMVAFALFLDGPSNAQATPLLSKMAGAIAAY
jgi:serine-type D-Ala-D-Ala carboxypeptidase/endopeptidase (penicillin-binding protein 4)